MYADTISEAMDKAIKETERRREIQIKYNEENNISLSSMALSKSRFLAASSISFSRVINMPSFSFLLIFGFLALFSTSLETISLISFIIVFGVILFEMKK